MRTGRWELTSRTYRLNSFLISKILVMVPLETVQVWMQAAGRALTQLGLPLHFREQTMQMIFCRSRQGVEQDVTIAATRAA